MQCLLPKLTLQTTVNCKAVVITELQKMLQVNFADGIMHEVQCHADRLVGNIYVCQVSMHNIFMNYHQ